MNTSQRISDQFSLYISNLLTNLKDELARSTRQFSTPWKFPIVRLLFYTAIMLAGLGAAYFYTRRIGLSFTGSWLLLAGIVIAGIFILEILVRWPALSLVGLLVVIFFVGWWMPTGTKVSIDITALAVAGLMGVWVLHMLLVERRLHLVPVRLNIPALAFIAAASISLILGNQRYGEAAAGGASLPAQIGGWILLVFPILLMLAAGSLLQSDKLVKLISMLFLVPGMIVATGSLIPGMDGIVLKYFHPNITMSIFWIMLTAIPAGQAIFNKTLLGKWRVVYALLALLALAGGLKFTEKLAHWIPPLIVLLVILWQWNWRWGLAVTAIGFVFALPVILWLVYTPATTYIYNLHLPWPYTGIFNIDSELSIRSRYATWPVMFELVKQSPFFGLGPANYKSFTNQYRIWEYFLPFNSHNNYWDLAAQTGLVGFGLFTWLAWEILRLAWRLHQQVQDGFSRGYAASMLAGFVGMLAAGVMDDYFMPFVYNIGFPGFRTAVLIWLFLGGLIGLENLRRVAPLLESAAPGPIS